MNKPTRLELEMGGSLRPLLFDFTFLDFLTDAISLADLDELSATRPWRAVPHILMAGLRAGADFEGGKEVFDLKTVTDWYRAMDALEVNKAVECHKAAMGFIALSLNGKPVEAES